MKERNLKKLILQLLEHRHLLSASEILIKLEKTSRKFNKTSVYRALEQLESDEVICRQYFHDTQAQYELRQDHHTHLVCRKCGDVEIASCDYDQPQQIQNFTIDHHHLTLIGVCANCMHISART